MKKIGMLCLFLALSGAALPAQAHAQNQTHTLKGYTCVYAPDSLDPHGKFSITLNEADSQDTDQWYWYCKHTGSSTFFENYSCIGADSHTFSWGQFGTVAGVCLEFIKRVAPKDGQ